MLKGEKRALVAIDFRVQRLNIAIGHGGWARFISGLRRLGANEAINDLGKIKHRRGQFSRALRHTVRRITHHRLLHHALLCLGVRVLLSA
jgi:hypothetical protein